MRALHLVKTATGGTWALRQMTELARAGVEVHVALPDGPLVAKYRSAGVTTHLVQTSFPMMSPTRWRQTLASFRNLVGDVRPDIIHSHFVGTTLTMRLALGASHQIPRLFQVPGPLHLEHAAYRRAEIATAGSADAWVGTCQWTCDQYLHSGISPDRVFLSYYGTEVERCAGDRVGTLRAQFEIASDRPIVGMVAYLYPPKRYLGQRRGLKGHEDLIDALAIVAERHPDVLGTFVGGAWGSAHAYEALIRAYAAERLGNRALFLGTRSDVLDLYPDFNVAVHPSHSENLGGAGESLLMGIPTIATNVGGFPDLVEPGETGWLVPAKNPPALAEAINAALADPLGATSMARRGQERARTLIDVRNTSAEVVRIYERLVDRPAPRRCDPRLPNAA